MTHTTTIRLYSMQYVVIPTGTIISTRLPTFVVNVLVLHVVLVHNLENLPFSYTG